MGNFSQPHICQCLSRILLARSDSTVTIAGDRRKTGRQFVDEVLSLSDNLLELDVCMGDVVAVATYNSDYYLELFLAVAFVGGILAPLNYRWSGREAMSAILMVRPVVLVMDESCADLDNSPVCSLRWDLSLGSSYPKSLNKSNLSFPDLLGRQSARSITTNYAWPSNGVAIICFTSGTTGKVYLPTSPLCHIGGLSSAIAMLMMGACHVSVPKFEPGSAVDAIDKHEVTSIITVPTFITDISSFLRGKESWKGAESIRKVLSGGGSLSVKLTSEAIRLFPSARILSAYGMTEACSSLTFTTLHDSLQCNQPLSLQEQQGTCIGKPAPHVEVRTDATDSVSSRRILTRGPHMMIGYWDQPLESDSSGASWFDTGDIGSIDESGGSGCSATCESYRCAVVVEVPEASLGEMVIGCVRISSDWSWSESDKLLQVRTATTELCSAFLRQFCLERDLTGFKITKVFLHWGSRPFPTTSTGKVQRDEVQSEVVSRRVGDLFSAICDPFPFTFGSSGSSINNRLRHYNVLKRNNEFKSEEGVTVSDSEWLLHKTNSDIRLCLKLARSEQKTTRTHLHFIIKDLS